MSRADWEAADRQAQDSDWCRQQRDDAIAAEAQRSAWRAAANSLDPDAAAHEPRPKPARVRKPAHQPAPEPAEPGLSELDRAVEKLVRKYTCGSVIDAAWDASHRIFNPQKRGAA